MKLEGRWQGYYEYGNGYPLPYFGERVKLEIDLIDTEEGFRGICKEEQNAYSVDEVAQIKGFEEEGIISFIKTYPRTYEISELEGCNIVSESELGITHSGIYDKDRDTMFGIWEIETDLDVKRNGEIPIDICEGIWKLTRLK